jgi:hypothetical protein
MHIASSSRFGHAFELIWEGLMIDDLPGTRCQRDLEPECGTRAEHQSDQFFGDSEAEPVPPKRRVIELSACAFVCYTGGAKVIAALEDAFGLADGTLAETRQVPRTHGNVLFVLEARRARLNEFVFSS